MNEVVLKQLSAAGNKSTRLICKAFYARYNQAENDFTQSCQPFQGFCVIAGKEDKSLPKPVSI
jgi:hypothetical protein